MRVLDYFRQIEHDGRHTCDCMGNPNIENHTKFTIIPCELLTTFMHCDHDVTDRHNHSRVRLSNGQETVNDLASVHEDKRVVRSKFRMLL